MANEAKVRNGRWGRRTFLTLGALLVAAQFVPFGRDHANPGVANEPLWDRPETRSTFVRACGDCHSNQTRWPWYSHVAPVSWLVAYDVEEGRSHFNVSEWGRPENEGDEAAELVQDGEMPPWYYLPMHPEARLTGAQKAEFVKGLKATFVSTAQELRDHEHESQ